MTCIAGLAFQGSVYMGGDSAAIDGQDLEVRGDPKVFRNGEYLIGFSESFRVGQVLQYRFSAPSYGGLTGRELTCFLSRKFIDDMWDSLAKAGVDVNKGLPGSVMLGAAGRLFVIYQDFHVAEPLPGYAAIGCGLGPAVGSLYSTPDRAPRERIELALEASLAHCTGVRPPFTIEELPPASPSVTLG